MIPFNCVWRRLLLAGITLLVGVGCSGAPGRAANAAADPWDQVPAILARIVPPTLAPREFAVTKFGATGDGQSSCTKAFNDAIAACAAAGGGRVVVPAGKFLTGAIHLRSGVELHLAGGAEIIFSDRLEDYLPVVFVRVGGIELYNYSPLIYARGCSNVAVTGKGKLNGNADKWWNWKGSESKKVFAMGEQGVPVEQRVFGQPEFAIRPSFLCLVSCTNILLEDFTIGSGPNWTIHPIYCQNLTVRRVNVATSGPNNDGIDPDSCRDVLIEHCTFDTGDDCVVLKSGYNEDGWRVGRPTENVIMRYCSSKRGHGGLVVGSEMSGDVRNVFMHDCQFDGTDRAIRIKSRRGRGGVVENIYARNLKVKNMKRDVAILNMDYSADRNQAANEKPPVFRNMQFEDITADGAPAAVVIQGLEDSPIENIRFKNVRGSTLTGVTANWAKGLVFDNVQITRDVGPVYNLKDCAGVAIVRSRASKGTGTFVNLEGSTSGGVKIEDCNLAEARTKFVTAEGVAGDAVEVK